VQWENSIMRATKQGCLRIQKDLQTAFSYAQKRVF